MALFRHVCSGTTPGESWSFTLHTTGSGSLASAQTGWNNAINSFWTDSLDAIVTPDVSVIETSTASLNPATGQQISRLIDDVSLPGVATGEMMPFQCAASVSWRTATATRAGRGRFYLPPLAVSTIDTGRLSTSAVTTIISSVGLLTSSLDSDGLSIVLFGRTTFTQTAVTSGDVGNVIDTQRRRRNKLIEARTTFAVP